MRIKLYYQNQTTYKVKNLRNFKRIVNKTIKMLGQERNYEVSLTIIDDDFIHQLNKQYRNIDRSTDVLSFAFSEEDLIEDKNIPLMLGDIFISIETATRQSKEFCHSLKRELSFLFTHGLLHLLGYDHMKKEDEEVMFGLQNKILDELRIRR